MNKPTLDLDTSHSTTNQSPVAEMCRDAVTMEQDLLLQPSVTSTANNHPVMADHMHHAPYIMANHQLEKLINLLLAD